MVRPEHFPERGVLRRDVIVVEATEALFKRDYGDNRRNHITVEVCGKGTDARAWGVSPRVSWRVCTFNKVRPQLIRFAEVNTATGEAWWVNSLTGDQWVALVPKLTRWPSGDYYVEFVDVAAKA